MNNKSITPNPQQPVDRVPTGQLPSALAELSEAALESAVQQCGRRTTVYGTTEYRLCGAGLCSYDGDDE